MLEEDSQIDPVIDDPEIIRRYQDARAKLLSGDISGALVQLTGLADQGVPLAHFVLGNIWLNMDDPDYPPDPARALHHYTKAAELEFPPAYSMLGRMYEHGKGVDQSLLGAMKYYVEGAKCNDRDCMVLAAQLFASGALGETKHDFAVQAYACGRAGFGCRAKQIGSVLRAGHGGGARLQACP